MKKRLVLFAAVCLLLVRAAGAEVISGAAALTEPLGVRPAGMGGAFAGSTADIHGLVYNPAGLADLDRFKISSMVASQLFDGRSVSLVAGGPVPWFGRGGMAVGVLLLSGPDMEVTGADDVSESLTSQQDLCVDLAFGQQILPQVLAGVNVKALRSTLVESYTAYAFAVDGGLLMQDFLLPGLNLGAVFQNLGTPLTYIDHGDPLPAAMRLGAAYLWRAGTDQNLLWDADIVLPADGDPVQHLGVEYAYQGTVFLRAGYRFGYALETFTLGAGLNWADLSLDYAYGKTTLGADLHRFGVGYAINAPGRERK